MGIEERMILASICAGITEIIIGVVSYFTGFGHFWLEKSGMLGFLGLGLVLYGVWHWIFLKK